MDQNLGVSVEGADLVLIRKWVCLGFLQPICSQFGYISCHAPYNLFGIRFDDDLAHFAAEGFIFHYSSAKKS